MQIRVFPLSKTVQVWHDANAKPGSSPITVHSTIENHRYRITLLPYENIQTGNERMTQGSCS